MHFLSEKLEFPPVNQTNEYGMLAIGGDLSKERLQLAYKNGVFPWFSDGEPIVWYCPQDRMVLFPEEFKVSKSMRQVIRKNEFVVTENQAFREVIYNCKNINRKEEFGTWITDEMQEAYIQLHKIGVAKSVEVWKNKELVGGLYGVEVGNVFCGESMFSKVSNASKVALHHLINERSETNPKQSKYQLIDCQIYNSHLASLGAREISRDEFLKILKG
ncbi:leucyl/phenylalanyl-tRNA--protein transferase [Urechidicola vernalis]|uniref:Leucyl/phenylalanyl-tRNA--protein transferase n=1 Tax=Urechidicola vernalis TaxID=3075600 RepID=A0ABU2Y489_9FLAO|nr:leucyl/phenylalanyl-tRNA--protein transferase [Urechidicola sp. P050]MDT0553008.1 leucyl/phenylalanyl-tRNA--protein transferase [Urechidicola sp. P050]